MSFAAAKLANVAPAWGTDFKVITPDKKIDHLYFKGIDLREAQMAGQQRVLT
jgi:hypothetical protein